MLSNLLFPIGTCIFARTSGWGSSTEPETCIWPLLERGWRQDPGNTEPKVGFSRGEGQSGGVYNDLLQLRDSS